MSDSGQQPQDVRSLFTRWRSGDAEAGVIMAQRFSDWYYALTVVRLGDSKARAPLERACQTFAQRIMEVTNAEDLIDFAHHIVREELQGAGNRVRGGDYPSAVTDGRSPTELLRQAADGLPAAQVRLLHQTYTAPPRQEKGMPLAALQARRALKVWLRENARVRFAAIPAQLDPDRAPVPLFESAHLASQNEETAFEQWMLTDLELCKDLIEFSAFAHALRGGALAEAAQRPDSVPPRTSTPTPPPAATPAPTSSDRMGGPSISVPTPPPAPRDLPATGGGSKLPLIIGGVVLVGVILAVIFKLAT